MTDRLRRLIAGTIIPTMALLTSVVLILATKADLPDPVASHWSLGGNPDDSVGRSTLTVLLLIVGVALIVGGWLGGRRRPASRGDLAPPLAIVAFLSWLFAGVAAAIVITNHGASSWDRADDLPVYIALLVAVPGLVAATAATRLVRSIGPSGEQPSAPAIVASADERVAWFSSVRARWPIALSAVVAILGVLFGLLFDPVSGIVLVLTGFLVAAFATVEVSADRRGLTVRYGPLRWPRTRIALDRIERASVIDVEPRRHGGWGYRGSLKFLGRAAVVIRAGEGIQLDLSNGKRFIVTVDDAATGAGTLTRLSAG